MADCECLGSCPFFNDQMKDLDGVAALFKRRYCLGDNSDCARHMVLKQLGKPAVPANLYPNNVERARLIISGS